MMTQPKLIGLAFEKLARHQAGDLTVLGIFWIPDPKNRDEHIPCRMIVARDGQFARIDRLSTENLRVEWIPLGGQEGVNNWSAMLQSFFEAGSRKNDSPDYEKLEWLTLQIKD